MPHHTHAHTHTHAEILVQMFAVQNGRPERERENRALLIAPKKPGHRWSATLVYCVCSRVYGYAPSEKPGLRIMRRGLASHHPQTPRHPPKPDTLMKFKWRVYGRFFVCVYVGMWKCADNDTHTHTTRRTDNCLTACTQLPQILHKTVHSIGNMTGDFNTIH